MAIRAVPAWAATCSPSTSRRRAANLADGAVVGIGTPQNKSLIVDAAGTGYASFAAGSAVVLAALDDIHNDVTADAFRTDFVNANYDSF